MKKQVEVVCYDRIEKWHDRRNAINFYNFGIDECDGLEAERYANIVNDLVLGKAICHDGYSRSYASCKANGSYRTTNAPDGSRDFGGKTWYQRIK